MIIKQIIIFLLMTFFLTGCVENNTEVESDFETIVDNNETAFSDATVILTTNSTTITLNEDRVEIDVTVIDRLNNPYEGGNVKIIYPNDVRDGRDIGVFTNSVVMVENGHAKFTYTAPKNISENTTDIVLGFYHDSDISAVKQYTIKLNPEQNQIVLTSYKIAIDDDDEPSMGLESNKLVSFMVKNKNDAQVDDSKITSITVTSLNPSLGTLENTLGDKNSSLTMYGKNSVAISIESNTLSGIIPLQVDSVFVDENGAVQNLSEVFNILVLSGPPTAMSLSYASTAQNKDNAKFIEKWILTVTDKYNNLVNTNPSVSMGMIAGYARSSGTTSISNLNNNLFYNPSVGGTMKGAENEFHATRSVFANIDQVNDVLVIFGNGYTYEASGKWDINTNTNNILDLVDSYNGKDTPSLGFAVGHNYRQDGSMEGVEWVGNVYPEDNNYIIDETGSLKINVEYDYYLTGKDVMLWVNLIGMNNDETVRIGEAKKVTLRGQGITPDADSFVVSSKAVNEAHTFYMKIDNTEEWYRHARFRAIISTSEHVVVNSINYSDILDNPSSVTVYVTSHPYKHDDNNKSLYITGNVSIADALITNEF